MSGASTELRRWAEARRAAAARENAETRALPPHEALRHALRLLALARRRHGWPLPVDAQSTADDQLGWERWARLRGQRAR